MRAVWHGELVAEKHYPPWAVRRACTAALRDTVDALQTLREIVRNHGRICDQVPAGVFDRHVQIARGNASLPKTNGGKQQDQDTQRDSLYGADHKVLP